MLLNTEYPNDMHKTKISIVETTSSSLSSSFLSWTMSQAGAKVQDKRQRDQIQREGGEKRGISQEKPWKRNERK